MYSVDFCDVLTPTTGAYRDNEVSESHPLTLSLKAIASHKSIVTIQLLGLNLQHVASLISDSLQRNIGEVRI